MSILYILLAIIVALILYLVFKYNGFITLRTRTQEAWSDIDVQLKRRYDLIPNLVNTVKGYAAHESGVFEKVTEARSRAMQAGTRAEKGEAENALSGTLKSLFAISEAYPDLKANQNFLDLQSQLEGTENRIANERRRFNEAAQAYNTKVLGFPTNLFARLFGFQKKAYFQSVPGSEKAPVVNFGK